MHCTELHVKTSLFYWMFVSVYISVETGHEEVKWLSSITGVSQSAAGPGGAAGLGPFQRTARRGTRCHPRQGAKAAHAEPAEPPPELSHPNQGTALNKAVTAA